MEEDLTLGGGICVGKKGGAQRSFELEIGSTRKDTQKSRRSATGFYAAGAETLCLTDQKKDLAEKLGRGDWVNHQGLRHQPFGGDAPFQNRASHRSMVSCLKVKQCKDTTGKTTGS